METVIEPTYYYPNKMGRIILLAMEEIAGKNGINAILNLSGLQRLINSYPPNNLDLQFAFEDVSRLQVNLENLYGRRGGRGVALRVGRACLKYGLREFGSMLGITDLAFRLLPLPMKLRVGAGAFAQSFNDLTDQIVRLEEEQDQFLWIIERCPVCWGRRSNDPVCQLAVGILQEALHWVSGGKHFQVEEIACAAMSDKNCVISLGKEPYG